MVSRGCPRGYPGGHSGAKTSVRPSKSCEKAKQFRADIHDPKTRTSMTTGELLGSIFGRTDFSRIFFFGPQDFFRGFSRRIFSPHFCGKSAQKNPPGKSPAKSSKICTTKIPNTFLQRGRAKSYKLLRSEELGAISSSHNRRGQGK